MADCSWASFNLLSRIIASVAPCCRGTTVSSSGPVKAALMCQAGSHLAWASRASTRPSGPPARTMLSDRHQSASTLDRACLGLGPSLTSCMLCVLTCATSSPLATQSTYSAQTLHSSMPQD